MKIPLLGNIKIGKRAVPSEDTLAKPKEVAKAPIKGGRESEPSYVSLMDALQQVLPAVSPNFELELINYIEHLAKYNGDISYAVDNIVQLGNTPYTISYGDDVQAEVAREMTKAVKDNTDRIYSGGVNSLINDLLAQAAITGAVSAEMIPEDDLSDIKKTVLVPTVAIRFFYDRERDEHMPYQKIKGASPRAVMAKDNCIPLNPFTYKYYALRRFGDSPYAIPPFLSALDSVMIEKKLICNLENVVKKLGIFGFMSILVTPPAKAMHGESDEQYLQRCIAYLESLRPEAEKGFNSGLSLGFKGSHEFNMENTNMNVEGARELFNLVSEFKMAGLKQDPLMLGRNFNVAETMARVIIAKLSTQIKNYQAVIGSFLANFVTTRLLLLGYGDVPNVTVEFDPALVTDKTKEEDAYGKKIDNYEKLYNQGIIDQQQRAQALGYEEPAEEEPRYAAPQDPNAPAGDDEPASEDVTDTESNRAVPLTKELMRSLGLYQGVPVGTVYAHVNLKNGTSLSNLIVKDRNILYVPKDESFSVLDIESIELETISELESLLGASVEPFDYEPLCGDDHCSHERFRDASFAKDAGDLFEHLNGYINATKGQYNKATKKVAAQIGKALGELGDGASLEQVQDKVIYTLYKTWGPSFTQAQAKVVSKYVELAYKSFRNDTEALGGKKDPPKATFGLRDVRTMEYFKKSDNLYLGKFITDTDVKKKVTAFIKEKYLNEGLPIGNNKKVLTAFKDEFAGMLDLQDWKIVSILSTTVNKMRNSAALSYMAQAEVAKFEIRGIGDRLQCEYCKSMQGRQFSVETALTKLDGLVTSDPAYVKAVSPFITDVFKGKDGREMMAGLTDEAIQASGIDMPSYHPSCRDRIVAIL